MADIRSRARELSREYLAKGEPTGWFEPLYAEVGMELKRVPWADLKPNPRLVEAGVKTAEGRAVVVGCGFGDDAEFLANLGFETTGFDIASTAIEVCRRRFPESKVKYEVADLLTPPEAWIGRFDFAFEAYTYQVLPPELRKQAMEQTCGLLRPGGRLLLIARARDEQDDPGSMPWPLTRRELKAMRGYGMSEVSFEEYFDTEEPPVRRFCGLYQREVS